MKHYSIDEFIQNDAGLRSLVEEVRPVVEDVASGLADVAQARFFGYRNEAGRFLIWLELSEFGQPEAVTSELTITDLRDHRHFRQVVRDLWLRLMSETNRRSLKETRDALEAWCVEA